MRGFILQPTYHIERNHPVIHLYGRLETGEAFLIRDDREIPHFYIGSQDLERARNLATIDPAPSGRRTLDGKPVARVNLRLPSDTPPLRDRLIRQGIRCYEADVRFAMRFLIDRGIRGSLEISSAGRQEPGGGRVYHNPEIQPERWVPELSVLSIDIETDPEARRLFSIALHGCGASEVLVVNPGNDSVPEGTRSFREQDELLHAFTTRIQELDPDVLTGWNVVDFDLKVLERVAGASGVALLLGRDQRPLRLRPSRSPWSSFEASITGRVVVDGIHLLRGSFVKMEHYSLDFVAREILGEGKTLSGDRAQTILDHYLHDRARLVEYNLTDARLVLEILNRLKLIELAVERSLLTGLPIDRIAGSVAAFDFLYLSQLHRRSIVAPSVGAGGSASAGSDPGGYVIQPEPGLYRNVLVFDFESLYPSLIRTFEIDPLGYRPQPNPDEDLIVSPNGASFRRQTGILTQLLEELLPRRKAAKASGDQVSSHAIKILMNSFYGVLGTPACRFHAPQLAGAITSFGRNLLQWSKQCLESYGFQVIYGDTDSLFLLSRKEQAEAAQALGHDLAKRLNNDLATHIQETWRVESHLKLQFEKLYRKLHIPTTRQGGAGARKRYVGLVGAGDSEELVFTGMEVVRRDWTELARQVQRELYRRLFSEQRLDEYLRQIVYDMRRARLDDQLIYHKALRKELSDYSHNPPHVAAARKMDHRSGRLISYYMTHNGPEPIQKLESPIDHEHYVQKQIRPVAEPLLKLLALDFAKVIGDDRQMELF